MSEQPYTINDLYDPTSPLFNSAPQFSYMPGLQNSFSEQTSPAVLASGEVVQNIDVAKGGALRSGQTAYNTGTGFWIGTTVGNTAQLSLGNPSGRYLTWDGTTLTVNGYSVATGGTFGGDGSDGALALTSGTTTISFASASAVIKNYTSISITSSGKLAFSNPATGGSFAVLRSQGAVTVTATATCIDASGMGAAGGAAVGPSTSDTHGNTGTDGSVVIFKSNAGVRSTSDGGGLSPGAGGAAGLATGNYPSAFNVVINRYPLALCGAGGGSGSINGGGGDAATSGAGGRGGGCLVIECAGAWNFTTASGISVAGAAGGNAVATANTNAGGGGGGSGGFFLALYNTLTASSGSVVSTGGTGGNCGTIATDAAGGGGGGFFVAGSNGTTAQTGKTGGDGAVGVSTIASNTVFA